MVEGLTLQLLRFIYMYCMTKKNRLSQFFILAMIQIFFISTV